MTWFPAADWTERPDPVAGVHARRGGTIRLNGAQPPKSFNAYVDNNTYSAMVFDLLYMKLLGMDPQTTELVPALARKWAVSDDGREFVFVLFSSHTPGLSQIVAENILSQLFPSARLESGEMLLEPMASHPFDRHSPFLLPAPPKASVFEIMTGGEKS